MKSSIKHYLGNPKLKASHVSMEYTQEQLDEYLKCADDPIYFIENYIKIVNVDRGLIPFEMYDFQHTMVKTFHENRFVIAKCPRQCGKSTTCVSYLLHYILFNENVNVGILANKLSLSKELMSKLQLSYENLPFWLQQGVTEWNKHSLELENGSRVIVSSTSSSAVRGMAFNLVMLDEFAFVPYNTQMDFFDSVYPTISSGNTTKLFIISTPNGMELFYKKWMEAIEGRNTFKPFEIKWQDVPGRDDKWLQETIANIGEERFAQEFSCEFIGSSNTLFNATKLSTMTFKAPEYSSNKLDLLELPVKGNSYMIVADTAEGKGLDYSAFIIFDITCFPYKVVGKFRDRNISPLLLPSTIATVAEKYNEAAVLIELNSAGEQVAQILHHDLEYENILYVGSKVGKGQYLGGQGQLGVKTSKAVKRSGCSNIKSLVDTNKIVIEDVDIIEEMTTFVQSKSSYEAQEGHNDDLVMCLVLFGWASAQMYFRDINDQDIRSEMYKNAVAEMEADLLPIGFLPGALETVVVDSEGVTWIKGSD